MSWKQRTDCNDCDAILPTELSSGSKRGFFHGKSAECGAALPRRCAAVPGSQNFQDKVASPILYDFSPVGPANFRGVEIARNLIAIRRRFERHPM